MCNYQDRENVDNECRSNRGVGHSFRGCHAIGSKIFNGMQNTVYHFRLSLNGTRLCIDIHTYVYSQGCVVHPCNLGPRRIYLFLIPIPYVLIHLSLPFGILSILFF